MQYINKNKLEKVKFTKSNFYVAVDFDRTITARKSNGTWDIGGLFLGDEFKQKSKEMYDRYSPIEHDYTISFDEKNRAIEEWFYKNFRLYYEYSLTEDMIEKSVKAGMFIFRAGAKEFLEEMHSNNIPVVILSAGIGNVIVDFLKENNCYFDNIEIISNFIPFNEDGSIKEFSGTLIHTLNKTMEGHLTENLASKIQGKSNRFLLGDFIEDKNMVPKAEWNNTVSVGFLDERVDQNLDVFKQNFDVVLTDEDVNFNIAKKIVLGEEI